MFWRKHTAKPIEIHEAPTAPKSSGSNTQITNANYSNFIVKAVGFSGAGTGSTDFESPDADFENIQSAIEADSYVSMAVRKYSQLIFKAGYDIVADNDAAAEYIKSRLRLMSFMTDTPTKILFQQIAEDLVAYSNAFLIKSRVEPAQLMGIQAAGILDTNPVGGYFRVDPATVTIKRDKNGTIKQYQQESGSESKKFKSTDVCHFYMDKKGGAAFGTPRLVAALEDVKLLRKIEGNVLDLIYRFAIPIYQMKVGLPQDGMMATSKEIDEAKAEIEKMASDGIMVTNERTQFIAIGADGEAIDVTGYLSYFEHRVFSALNMSEAMMGRGGAKQDADSMEEQVHDTVKFIQQTVATFIENTMFNEMLLEGGFNPITNEQDIVKFQFHEINLDTKVKMETNALNQFQGNAITFAELRKALGLQSDNVDLNTLFANMIQQPNALALIQAKMAGSSSGTTNSTSANTGTSGPDNTQKPSGSTNNTIQPANQHGTSSVNIKEHYDNIHDTTEENIEKYKKNFSDVYKKYSTLRNDICERGVNYSLALPVARDSISKEINKFIESKASEGIEKALQDTKSQKKYTGKKIIITEVEKKARQTLTNMLKDVEKRLKQAEDENEKRAAFDATEYRLRFLLEEIVMKSYWYAYVKTCSNLKVPEVYIQFAKNSDDKKLHSSIVNTKAFSLDDIPPYNAYCTCKITTKSNKKAGGT